MYLPPVPIGSGNRSSMGSISSRYLHVGPAGPAPHQGRPIKLTMPAPLAASNEEFGSRANGLDTSDGRGGHQTRLSRGWNEGESREEPVLGKAADSMSLSHRLFTHDHTR